MPELLISADSHVMENPGLWEQELPASFADSAPNFRDVVAEFAKVGVERPGGFDSRFRVGEMEQDGVHGEVLYPTLALDLFGLTDVRLQQACFRVYNDWLVDYCSIAPNRLYAVALLPAHDINAAITELRRCHQLGVRGGMVWQNPPDGLEFSTPHYDPLWATAQELGLPISLHIYTGKGYPFSLPAAFPAIVRQVVANKLHVGENALSDFITSGVFERFPQLKIVFVENEVSWLPFALSQWDKYAKRYAAGAQWAPPMTRSATSYFETNVYATFFNDPPAWSIFGAFAPHNLMWANDYPHPNSTWPHSAEVIQRDLGHLDQTTRHNLTAGNAINLYALHNLTPQPTP